MSKIKKSQLMAGFSLLEVLIAFIILAIGVVAIGRVQSLFVANENLAEQKAEATNLAHAKLEQFRSYSKLTGTGNSYANISSGKENVTGRNTTFELTWNVNENTNPSYKTIDVDVIWTAQDGISRKVTLSSIIGKMDPVAAGRAIQQSTSAGDGGVAPPM